MTRHALSIAAVSLACLAASAASADTRSREASFPARSGKSRLVFECADDKAIWLRIWNPARGWQGDRPAEVKIGETTFRTEIDGATDSVLLSDVPLPAMGVSPALLAAAKAGTELVLAGIAAEQIPGPNRSFPLKGARTKILRVEKACGRPAAAGPIPRHLSTAEPTGSRRGDDDET